MLQFVGAHNGAIFVLVAALVARSVSGQGFVPTTGTFAVDVALCLISFLVALMGLATEYSTSSYFVRYFAVLREVDETLNRTGLADPESGVVTQNGLLSRVGIASYGKTLEDDTGQFDQRFHRRLPVQRAHKIFYGLLMVIWALGPVWLIASRQAPRDRVDV